MFSLLSLLSRVGTKFKHMYTANTSVCSHISQLLSILLEDTAEPGRGENWWKHLLDQQGVALDERLYFKTLLQCLKNVAWVSLERHYHTNRSWRRKWSKILWCSTRGSGWELSFREQCHESSKVCHPNLSNITRKVDKVEEINCHVPHRKLSNFKSICGNRSHA